MKRGRGECRGARASEEDERDVKDWKCEHAPEGISKSSRQSLKLNSRGVTALMAACSSFSFSISAATSKSMSRTSSMSGLKALDTHWSPAEQFALLCCSPQIMLYIPRLLGPLSQGAEIRSSWQSEARSNGVPPTETSSTAGLGA